MEMAAGLLQALGRAVALVRVSSVCGIGSGDVVLAVLPLLVVVVVVPSLNGGGTALVALPSQTTSVVDATCASAAVGDGDLDVNSSQSPARTCRTRPARSTVAPSMLMAPGNRVHSAAL